MDLNRQQRRQMTAENLKRPKVLTEVPKEDWPNDHHPDRVQVWLSRDFLVQVFDEANAQRLSVNRTSAHRGGKWNDNITWDELQEIKRQVGMGRRYAIEVYPRDRDIVNVANVRHLWIPNVGLPFGWVRP